MIIGTLNINSISSKFDDLKVLISGVIDILIITETKLDETYPISQFHIDGYSMPYRLDRNRNGGGVIIYVRKDIPSKILRKHFFPNDIEGIFVELNFRKSKWLLCGTYHPPSQSDQYYFDNIDKALDVYCQYEKIMLVGDFNAQIGEKCFDDFLFQHELRSVNDRPTCYKNPDKPSCIDFILTNSPLSFHKSNCLFTGLSDCHKLVLPVFKTTFSKSKPKEIIYRNFKKFNEKDFNQELRGRLSTELVDNYSSFENVFIDVLNRYVTIKKKVIRANHAPYVTKALRKAIMKRSQLEKIYFKKRTQESFKKYKKQKNYCSRLYKRERKSFFESIDSSKITDNKTFWKNIQPFFSEKRKIVNKITLVNENENILSNDKVVADEINSFFKNATKNLGITENTYIVDNSNGITDPVNKAIDKFKNHPSILLIQRKVANDSTFSFNEASLSDIEKELRLL